MNDIISLVISTLNTVEVKGEDNMDKLVGCIRALRTVAKALEAPTGSAEPEPSKEEPNG